MKEHTLQGCFVRIDSECGIALAGLEGRIPNQPLDNRSRVRSMLHRRINAAGNNLAVTFLKRPFDPKVRQKANEEVLKRLKWKFPLKKKTRAMVPHGPDARAFHSDPQLLVSLFKLFYATELQEKQAARDALDALGRTAANATNMQAEAEQAAREGRRTSQSRQRGRSRSCRQDDDSESVTVRGVSQDTSDVSQYRSRRREGAGGQTAQSQYAESSRAAVSADNARATSSSLTCGVGAAGDSGVDGDLEDEGDESLAVEDDLLEEDLPEDAKVDVLSAINVWRTSILHQEAVAAKPKNRFDFSKVYYILSSPPPLYSLVDPPWAQLGLPPHLPFMALLYFWCSELQGGDMERYAIHGEQTGAAWQDAMLHQSSNVAFWMYPHDSACHFYEDVMENGVQEAYDDTILETGNGKLRQFSKRKVFHGGNNSGAKIEKQRVTVVTKNSTATGEVSTKTVRQALPLGQAAQTQRWHMLQQITDANRLHEQLQKQQQTPNTLKQEVRERLKKEKSDARSQQRECVKNEMSNLYDTLMNT